jgi:hypothetical protein
MEASTVMGDSSLIHMRIHEKADCRRYRFFMHPTCFCQEAVKFSEGMKPNFSYYQIIT